MVDSLPKSTRQMTDDQASAFAKGRFLPLAPFMWQWHGPMGEAFRRNAPHLFPEGQKRAPHDEG